MNRLRLIVFASCLLSAFSSFSQQGLLFIKTGAHKKRTYTEGDLIHLKLSDGTSRKGVITLLRNDTIFVNRQPVYRPLVSQVILDRKSARSLPDVKTMLLIGAGSALTAAGLTLSKQAKLEQAIVAGLVIGYGPLLVRYLGEHFIHLFIRKKFRIGRKYRLQVLDFYLPNNHLRSF
jgi:hypothetical protein